jgi:hypothetical protein
MKILKPALKEYQLPHTLAILEFMSKIATYESYIKIVIP